MDIYGALSEYIGMCVSGDTVTLLDINNSVPASMYEAQIKGKFGYDYQLTDTFMGFHCGNTPSCKLCADRAVKYQLIQHRLLEPPALTRTSPAAPWRRHRPRRDYLLPAAEHFRREAALLCSRRRSAARAHLLLRRHRRVRHPGDGPLLRHVLIEKRYPHHGAVAFGHHGKALFELFKLLGVQDIGFNQPKGMLYKTENPFA